MDLLGVLLILIQLQFYFFRVAISVSGLGFIIDGAITCMLYFFNMKEVYYEKWDLLAFLIPKTLYESDKILFFTYGELGLLIFSTLIGILYN